RVLREVRGGEGLIPAVEGADRDVRVLVGGEVDLGGFRTGGAVGPLAAACRLLGAARLGGVGVGGTAGGEGEEAGGQSAGQRHERGLLHVRTPFLSVGLVGLRTRAWRARAGSCCPGPRSRGPGTRRG